MRICKQTPCFLTPVILCMCTHNLWPTYRLVKSSYLGQMLVWPTFLSSDHLTLTIDLLPWPMVYVATWNHTHRAWIWVGRNICCYHVSGIGCYFYSNFKTGIDSWIVHEKKVNQLRTMIKHPAGTQWNSVTSGMKRSKL